MKRSRDTPPPKRHRPPPVLDPGQPPRGCPFCHAPPHVGPAPGRLDYICKCDNGDCPVACYCYGASPQIAVDRWNWRVGR